MQFYHEDCVYALVQPKCKHYIARDVLAHFGMDERVNRIAKMSYTNKYKN